MSPIDWMTQRVRVGFPRVSGDEPAIKAFQEANGGFSPRERG